MIFRNSESGGVSTHIAPLTCSALVEAAVVVRGLSEFAALSERAA